MLERRDHETSQERKEVAGNRKNFSFGTDAEQHTLSTKADASQSNGSKQAPADGDNK
jgi:hypothetical protein